MKKYSRKFRFAAIILIVSALMLFSYLAFLNFYHNKFFPGISIANRDVGGQNIFSLTESLNQEYQIRKERLLSLTYQGQIFSLDLNSGSPEIDFAEITQTAYAEGRSGNILPDIKGQIKLLTLGENFSPKIKFKNSAQISSQINLINQKIKRDATAAQIIFSETINITPSEEGVELDSKTLFDSIEAYLKLEKDSLSSLPVKPIFPTLTTAKAEKYKTMLETVKKTPIKLIFENDSWVIDQATLYSLLDFDQTKAEIISFKKDGQNFTLEEITIGRSTLTDHEILLDKDGLANFIEGISKKIDQSIKEATFVFDEATQRVTQFQPGQEGRELNKENTAALISQAVEDGNIFEISLPVAKTYPKTSASDVNNFGIKELLGIGTSSFIDSIPNRVFNIGLASSRINGILVAPGEIFSFNQYLGEISATTGFKQAYVIKEGKTILDDGGGVCQVSTTLFRAVLNAGLPIVERTAHAYRVGFYEQGGTPAGFDATVYPPSVDFKFKNDTQNYILIQNQMIGTTLIFKIYGTSDDRITTIGKPIVLSQTPPPPDLRQDDPTLPKGVEKEIEHAIWGMNTQFKRIVVKNGETIIDEVWRSNFRPWQKVILVGTKE